MKAIKNFLIRSNGRLWNTIAVLLYGKKVFIKNKNPFVRTIIKSSIPKKFHDKIKYYKNTINTAKEEHKNCIFYLEDNGTLIPTEKITGVNILFSGHGNVIIISKSCTLSNCKIHLGNNNFCLLEKSLYPIYNLHIISHINDNGCIIIDKNFSCHGVIITSEEGKNVFIDEDNMFSYDINMWNTDGHAILDKNGICQNYGIDIYIGKHVWIGHGVEILKGTYIQDNSLVGAKSVVTGRFNEGNCAIAGNPAHIIKREITWDRKSPAYF